MKTPPYRAADVIAAGLNIEASKTLQGIVWLIAVLFSLGLGYLRVATDAEYAFASAVILPVVAVTWIGGCRAGVIFSALASLMWMSADLLAQRQFSASWIPVLNGLTRLAVYSLIAWLVASLRGTLQREQRLARHDALTGLFNRRAFFEIGQDETDRARRYEHSIGIAFLDLDNFKRLNDTRGHAAGDRALKAAAAALKGSLRGTDRVARLGGDEFGVLLPEATLASATDAGNKLTAAIDHALKEFSPVSVSVGIAWFERAASFDTMVKAADGLMYEIKESGKHGAQTRRFAAAPVQPASAAAPDRAV